MNHGHAAQLRTIVWMLSNCMPCIRRQRLEFRTAYSINTRTKWQPLIPCASSPNHAQRAFSSRASSRACLDNSFACPDSIQLYLSCFNMDLTLPEFAISSDPFLGIAKNGIQSTTCTLTGIDWNTGTISCVNEHGYVLFVVLLFGVLAGAIMLWFSAVHNSISRVSGPGMYDPQKDPFRMFARWPGRPWETTSRDEQRGRERQEPRHDSVQESRPLLHVNDAAWCDYCTMVQQRREQQIAEYGCNV